MSQGVVLDETYLATVSAVQRANAWVASMASYRTSYEGDRQEWPLRGEVERAKERYVTGEITLEAFEARLNIAFGISV